MNLEQFDRDDYSKITVTTDVVDGSPCGPYEQGINYYIIQNSDDWIISHWSTKPVGYGICKYCGEGLLCQCDESTNYTKISSEELSIQLDEHVKLGCKVVGIRPVAFDMKPVITQRISEIKTDIPPKRRWMSCTNNGVLVASEKFYFPKSFETVMNVPK